MVFDLAGVSFCDGLILISIHLLTLLAFEKGSILSPPTAFLVFLAGATWAGVIGAGLHPFKHCIPNPSFAARLYCRLVNLR